MENINKLTSPPKRIRFFSDETEIELSRDMQPTPWHKKNALFVYTYTKAKELKGQSFAMGLPQINALINGKRISYDLTY